MSQDEHYRFLKPTEPVGSSVDRWSDRTIWGYGALAALLLGYGTWRVSAAVWNTQSVAARTILVVALLLAFGLAANDLRRRRLGIFTGLVCVLWALATLLVILFGDLYFVVTGR